MTVKLGGAEFPFEEQLFLLRALVLRNAIERRAPHYSFDEIRATLRDSGKMTVAYDSLLARLPTKLAPPHIEPVWVERPPSPSDEWRHRSREREERRPYETVFGAVLNWLKNIRAALARIGFP